ncbi:fused MFS/spermidine synthase [Candidatus Gottesmanbacteria bacterium]|nr:fused MFS/spermidine synthase [Candidatus Gottesmanbacteria bacterium]
MSWLSYLLPRTLVKTSSIYNEDIRVIEDAGSFRLLVNGSRQSDPSIYALWHRAMGAFAVASQPGINTILVFGVGGGSVITMLSGMFPDCRITAVDIDPTIITIAKTFFHLDALPHVKLVCADAKLFVRTPKARSYDMMVVDLFIGRIIPEFVSSPTWYRQIRRMLRPGGLLLINYLQEAGYGKKSSRLKNELRRQFSVVKDLPAGNNRFFMAY